MSDDAIKRVLDLCDEWDTLSKGETPTTRRIREAVAGPEHLHTVVKRPDGSYGACCDTAQLTLFGEPCD